MCAICMHACVPHTLKQWATPIPRQHRVWNYICRQCNILHWSLAATLRSTSTTVLSMMIDIYIYIYMQATNMRACVQHCNCICRQCRKWRERKKTTMAWIGETAHQIHQTARAVQSTHKQLEVMRNITIETRQPIMPQHLAPCCPLLVCWPS